MPTIWLTPEQVRQLEQLLCTAFIMAHGEEREAIGTLYAAVAKAGRATGRCVEVEPNEVDSDVGAQ